MNTKTTIAKMVRRIARKFHPLRIILFGSRARGTAGPDSDVDLLVVFPRLRFRRRRAVEIYKLLAGSTIPKDILVVNIADIEAQRNVVGTVIREALQEGKTLYERSA